MRRLLLITMALAPGCTNVGFVDKAKSAAAGTFGVEVFVTGGAAQANFLTANANGFDAACDAQSGIRRANCYCQSDANSRQMSGTFRAWLSLAGAVDAICNIQGKEITGCAVDANLGPFMTRANSGITVLAENYSELSTVGFRTGLATAAGLIWTGTNPDGRASGGDCNLFATLTGTSTAGDQATAGLGFTTGQSTGLCASATTGRLLCMKQSN